MLIVIFLNLYIRNTIIQSIPGVSNIFYVLIINFLLKRTDAIFLNVLFYCNLRPIIFYG